jgi:YVTN family beta-propeller protein
MLKKALKPLLLGCSLLATPAFADLAYVSNEKDNSISVIDLKTLEVKETIDVGQRPRGIIFSKDYSKLYICASDDDTVQIMDVATGQIIDTLPSGEDPEQFSLAPNDRHLYISNEDDALVTIVDTKDSTVLAQIDVGVEPEGMAVSPQVRLQSIPLKPPVCFIGSIPKPMSCMTILRLISVLVTLNSIKTVLYSGPPLKLAAPLWSLILKIVKF